MSLRREALLPSTATLWITAIDPSGSGYTFARRSQTCQPDGAPICRPTSLGTTLEVLMRRGNHRETSRLLCQGRLWSCRPSVNADPWSVFGR